MDAIIHWTTRDATDAESFDNLKAIWTSKHLWLNHCPTHTQGGYKREVRMACFTDTPLEACLEVCKKFGKCGIAFRKDKMIEYGANPVFYTTHKYLGQIKRLHKFVDKLLDAERDSEWKSQLEPYQFTEDELISLRDIVGFTQEYTRRNDVDANHVNYDQNEWRIAASTLKVSFREASPGTCTPRGSSAGALEYSFVFDPEDIEFFVVPRFFSQEMATLSMGTSIEIKIFEDSVH